MQYLRTENTDVDTHIHTKSIFNEEKISLRFRLGVILKFGLLAVFVCVFILFVREEIHVI